MNVKIDIKKVEDRYELYEEYQIAEDRTAISVSKLIFKNNAWYLYDEKEIKVAMSPYLLNKSLQALNNFVRKEKLEKLLS